MSRDQKKCLEVLCEFTDGVIKSRRNELLGAKDKAMLNENAEDEDLGTKRKVAFLDLLLQATIDGKPLTDLDIREEVDTFMFEVNSRYFIFNHN